MIEAESNQRRLPENQKGLPETVVHTIVEFSDSTEVASHKTEKRKQFGRRYRQIGIACMQLNEDGTTPLYTHFADPELIRAVFSDELTNLSPEESAEKIEHLKNPAYQATYRLAGRLKKFAAEQNSNDQNVIDFLEELRAISPLYKNLDTYQLLALITRESRYDFFKILKNPEEQKENTERRNKSKQIGNRQRGLVLGLLERDDKDEFVYDYYGDEKLVKDVWADKINKDSTKKESQRKVGILIIMAHESVTKFIARLRKGDAKILKFLEEYRENNPYYEHVGNEELIAILTRKRSLSIELKKANSKKRMKVKSVKKKSSEKSPIKEKSVKDKSSSTEKSKKRPNKRKPTHNATKKVAPKKVPTTIIVPRTEPTSTPHSNTPITRDPSSPFLNHLIDVKDGIEGY